MAEKKKTDERTFLPEKQGLPIFEQDEKKSFNRKVKILEPVKKGTIHRSSVRKAIREIMREYPS